MPAFVTDAAAGQKAVLDMQVNPELYQQKLDQIPYENQKLKEQVWKQQLDSQKEAIQLQELVQGQKDNIVFRETVRGFGQDPTFQELTPDRKLEKLSQAVYEKGDFKLGSSLLEHSVTAKKQLAEITKLKQTQDEADLDNLGRFIRTTTAPNLPQLKMDMLTAGVSSPMARQYIAGAETALANGGEEGLAQYRKAADKEYMSIKMKHEEGVQARDRAKEIADNKRTDIILSAQALQATRLESAARNSDKRTDIILGAQALQATRLELAARNSDARIEATDRKTESIERTRLIDLAQKNLSDAERVKSERTRELTTLDREERLAKESWIKQVREDYGGKEPSMPMGDPSTDSILPGYNPKSKWSQFQEMKQEYIDSTRERETRKAELKSDIKEQDKRINTIKSKELAGVSEPALPKVPKENKELVTSPSTVIQDETGYIPKDNPAIVTTKKDFDDLRVGDYFVNPKDKQVYRKK